MGCEDPGELGGDVLQLRQGSRGAGLVFDRSDTFGGIFDQPGGVTDELRAIVVTGTASPAFLSPRARCPSLPAHHGQKEKRQSQQKQRDQPFHNRRTGRLDLPGGAAQRIGRRPGRRAGGARRRPQHAAEAGHGRGKHTAEPEGNAEAIFPFCSASRLAMPAAS